MDNNTKLMSIVLNLEGDLFLTREYASDIIIFRTFSSVQTNAPIWTPASGKSIFLTALQVSASSPAIITLNRENNNPFISIILTNTLATYSESFSSPIRFKLDEGITITSNTTETINITLLGYEI